MDHDGVWYLGLQLKINKDEEVSPALGINIKHLEESQRSKMLLIFPFFKEKNSSMLKELLFLSIALWNWCIVVKTNVLSSPSFLPKEDLQYLKSSPHKDHERK